MREEEELRQSIEPKILLIDWQRARSLEVVESLRHYGIKVTHAESPNQAELYRSDVVLLPACWPCLNGDTTSNFSAGLATLRTVLRLSSHPKVIVFRGTNEMIPVVDCCIYLSEGAHCYVDSCEASELKTHILECLDMCSKRRWVDHGVTEAAYGNLGLVWSSEAMRSVIEQVHKAAMLSDVTILITGQTGTGKQRIAEAIHQLDKKRQAYSFITVNCSSIATTLAESELFGHRRGAFTGATEHRVGYFRAANLGTLFLDEIGELELSLQPKLLRAIEERQIRAVGEDKEMPINVRLIAATNRDLRAMVAEGHFRMDLYQRLCIININVPPLSHRPEDILPLMHFFIDKYRSFYPGEITSIDPRIIEFLTKYNFEGNIRELENLVRRILFEKKHGRRIELEDLPKNMLKSGRANPELLPEKVLSSYLLELIINNRLSLDAALNYCERILLTTALKYTKGNGASTAKLLKIAERTFFNKIRRHNLKGYKNLMD